ncbi:MAG: serine hydrolase, partial [Pseudoflavonifractor sp.]
MKKNCILSYCLALALTAGLLAPFSSAKALSTDDMHVAAKAAILVDTSYGEVLFAQNANEKMFPASITKVMTGLLAIEAVEAGKFTMDQPI